MEEENKSTEENILDDVEEIEVTETESKPMEDIEDYVYEEPSDTIKFDVELSVEDKDKIFEISNAEFQKAKTKDSLQNHIKPEPFNDKQPDKVGYKAKMLVNFKDTNYAAIIPSIRWYANKEIKTVNGVKKEVLHLKSWFNKSVTKENYNNQQTSEVARLYFDYCNHIGQPVGKVTDRQFLDGLVGKKVKLKTVKGNYLSKDWAKLVIVEFVK